MSSRIHDSALEVITWPKNCFNRERSFVRPAVNERNEPKPTVQPSRRNVGRSLNPEISPDLMIKPHNFFCRWNARVILRRAGSKRLCRHQLEHLLCCFVSQFTYTGYFQVGIK